MKKVVKIPTLTACLQARKPELITYLEKICTKKGDKFWFKKSKVAKAVTLVCHIDTAISDTDRVWNQKEMKYTETKIRRRIFFDRKLQAFCGPDGLGADDRAGVWGILRVYTSLPQELKPNLLFCDEEETGGKGARDAARLLPELKDSLFFIEIDRRGTNDCVFYNQESDDFVKYIESFGFKKEFGTFSDISHLGREFDLCGSNLSAGYFNEHTRHETLYCRPLNDTIFKTISLVANATKEGKIWTIPKAVPVKYNDSYWDRQDYGCHSRYGRGLFDGKHRSRIPQYSKEELAMYPYLAELQAWSGNH